MIGVRSALLAATNSGGPPGFGAKYADPITLPPDGVDVAFSPDGNAIVVAHSSGLIAYPWSSVTGFGNKYPDPPPGLGGNPIALTFSPSGDAIAVSYQNIPNVTVYRWSPQTGFGSVYANPQVLSERAGRDGICFSPAGDAIMVSGGRIGNAWRWSSANGFGTKYDNPTGSSNDGRGFAKFNPTGNFLATGLGEGSIAFPWSSANGFGTAIILATTSGSTALGGAFSPSGDALITLSESNPTVTARRWSSVNGPGSLYANPATQTGRGNKVAFHPAGDAVVMSDLQTSNTNQCCFRAYPWSSATGFGVKYPDPANPVLPTGAGVAFSPAGDAVAIAHSRSPFISVYRWNS